MNGTGCSVYRAEPNVELGDLSWFHRPSWDELDDITSELVGCPATTIPSVRVALTWTLDYLGCRRHSHHVLVPRFVGRCILNSIGRVALPVEQTTNKTGAVIAVHQFGFTQRLDLIQAECAARAIPYVEDSPYGIARHEQPGPGSLAKVIGFSKVLPALKGGFALSGDPLLVSFIKQRRSMWSAWSWPLLGMMFGLRWGLRAESYSVLGDVAYELFPTVAGDNGIFRGNLLRALSRMKWFERKVAERVGMLARLPVDQVHRPDTDRLLAVVPFEPEGDPLSAQGVFMRNGFDANLYHFDVSRNLFAPHYVKVLLIPVNPRIPYGSFARLIDDLASLSEA